MLNTTHIYLYFHLTLGPEVDVYMSIYIFTLCMKGILTLTMSPFLSALLMETLMSMLCCTAIGWPVRVSQINTINMMIHFGDRLLCLAAQELNR